MANLTLIERLQLVKAGYKAKEIEAMIIKESSETAESEEPAENTSKGDEVADQVKEQDETPASVENNDEPDYKQLFENLKKEHEDTLQKLDAAQKKNAAADVSGNVPKEDAQTKINNIFKEIIS